MARRKKDAGIDLAAKHELTAGLIEALRCPEGKEQAFLRDSSGNGLRVRVTASGAKSFVFESKVNGKTLRRTIGMAGPGGWTIEAARTEAAQLRVLVDKNLDPRELERQETEEAQRLQHEASREAAAAAAEAAAQAMTVGSVWARYLAERRPRWGERNYADHLKMAQPGGAERKRTAGPATKPGPLAALMPMRLADLNATTLEAWAAKEAQERPASVRLSLRLLKAFLRWAAAEPDLKGRVDPTAASAKKAREAAGKPKTKDDVLQREQLKPWFAAVRAIPNQTIAAYLQTLLLTGARPGEVLSLRWEDVNAQWHAITIRDKVEGTRQIPLTPYVWALLSGLPRRNQWVFASTRAISLDARHIKRREQYHAKRGTVAPLGGVSQASASGRLVEAGIAHSQACAVAGIGTLTQHGLRRSFASLTEWLEVPAGVVAQIQGHKPSATAEKHYKRRPLELLRVHHERIEAWMLEQAGVQFTRAADAKPALSAVSAA